MLRELQLDLAEAFGEASAEGVVSRRLLGGLRPVGRASADRTIAVYQSALRRVVESALLEIFPVCAELVGADCFRGIARLHAARHVSRHPDLGRIGDDVPDWLPSLAFLDAVPYLADVARLELALHRAADAPDPAPIEDAAGAERLAAALSGAPDRWGFSLPPSATLLESVHPVGAIWAAHAGHDEDPGDDDGRWAIARTDEPDRLFVWRAPDGLRVEPVEPGLWPMLASIERGATVSALLALSADGVAESLDDDPADHAPLLDAIGLLFERGWIAGVAPRHPAPGDGVDGREAQEQTD